MSDSAESSTVDSWLQPLPDADAPCGADPEYDNDFQVELPLAAKGKEPDQFEAAKGGTGQPPDWRQVRRLCESIFERCRDVRAAVYWARAMLHVEGAATLADSMRLVRGLLENFWDRVHPVPDDGDAYARINALNDMASVQGLVGDLRQALVVRSRSIGEVRGRDIEVALGLLDARPEDAGYTKGQLQQMFSAAVDADPALRSFPAATLGHLDAINGLMREKVGYGAAPNLEPLIDAVKSIASLLPSDIGDTGNLLDDLSIGGGSDMPAAGAAPVRIRAVGAGLSGSIETRQDALRAIDMVCEYLERTEPTNPAQLLLRRARKLVDKNFLELVREFAPQSVEEVARILGVPPEEYGGSSY